MRLLSRIATRSPLQKPSSNALGVLQMASIPLPLIDRPSGSVRLTSVGLTTRSGWTRHMSHSLLLRLPLAAMFGMSCQATGQNNGAHILICQPGPWENANTLHSPLSWDGWRSPFFSVLTRTGEAGAARHGTVTLTAISTGLHIKTPRRISLLHEGFRKP